MKKIKERAHLSTELSAARDPEGHFFFGDLFSKVIFFFSHLSTELSAARDPEGDLFFNSPPKKSVS